MDSDMVKWTAEGFIILSMGKGPMKRETLRDLVANKILRVDNHANRPGPDHGPGKTGRKVNQTCSSWNLNGK